MLIFEENIFVVGVGVIFQMRFDVFASTYIWKLVVELKPANDQNQNKMYVHE